MSEIEEYAQNLKDEELFQELIKRGFPAGPVVATTRRIYLLKLITMLENERKSGKQEVFETLTSKGSPAERSAHTWSAHTSPAYSQSSRVSTNLGSYTSTESTSGISVPRSSWSASSSPFRPQSSRESPSQGDPGARFRYSLATPRRGIHEPQLSQSSTFGGSQTRPLMGMPKAAAQLTIISVTVLAAILILIYLYYSWTENDPYAQIEEEAKRLIEESQKKD